MNTQDLLALFDQEQRVEIEVPGMRTEATPHVVRLLKPPPGMNDVIYSDLDEHNAGAVIKEQIAYFRPLGQPFGWDVYEHDHPADLRQRLTARGFQPEEEPGAVMVLDLEETPAALLTPITADARRLARREQLEDVIAIMQPVWGGDFGWMRGRMGPHMELPGYLSVYVAYVEGRPACAAWIYFYEGSHFAGLYGGSTVPEFRQRGLYTALLAARAQEANRRGYRYLLINAGRVSQPIVERHGFRLLTRAWSCEWKGRG